MTEPFTKPQKDAMDKIQDLMREHFEAGVCVLMTDDSSDRGEASMRVWHGGRMTCLGLLTTTYNDLLHETAVAEGELE